MKLYLIGYRCTGKTTIGQELARSLGFGFVDTDAWVTHHAGMSISDLVALKGWPFFRKLESLALARTLEMDRAVIATGGGIILDPENQEILQKQFHVIWLNASEETILKRMALDPATRDQRPALEGQEKRTDHDTEAETCRNLASRTPIYQSLGRLTLNTGELSVDQCVTQIRRSMTHDRI